MVLHFVRSHSFLELLNEKEQVHFKEFMHEAILSNPEKYNEIDNGFLELRKKWRVDIVKSIPKQLKNNILKVEDFVSDHNIEIGEAPEGSSFILSDTPALNISDDGRIGIKGGVGITNSIGFAIPLGPKYIAALSVKPQAVHYIKLSDSHVKNINIKAIQGSLHEFYSAPLRD